jgi:flagella basal body P-ring formation protein FlgA
VNAKVGVYQDVVRTVNSVQRGNIVSPSDVIVERTRTERILADVPTTLSKVIGQAATKNLKNGEYIISISQYAFLKKNLSIKKS